MTFSDAENKFFHYLRKEHDAKSKIIRKFFHAKAVKWKDIADKEFLTKESIK